MKPVRYRRALLLGGVALVVLGGWVWHMLHDTVEKPLENEQPYATAPDFTLPDASGNPVSLADMASTVRIINFWASWSPYSKDELHALVELKRTFGDEITVIALDRDINPNDGRHFLQSIGLSDELTFVFDMQDDYFKKIEGYAVPETVFLDREGHIRSRSHGPMVYDEMERAVRELLRTDTR